jgi:hypothetical protein
MTNVGHARHRQLDRDFAESEARDRIDVGDTYIKTAVPSDIARPRRWRQDSTVSGGRNEPKVLLMTLSERVSGKGTRYFSGWLGKARLVGFLSDETDKEGRPLWNIYAAEPQPREGLAGGARQRAYASDGRR